MQTKYEIWYYDWNLDADFDEMLWTADDANPYDSLADAMQALEEWKQVDQEDGTAYVYVIRKIVAYDEFIYRVKSIPKEYSDGN